MPVLFFALSFFFSCSSVLFLHLYSTQDLMHPQRSHSLMIHNPHNKSLASTSSANHGKHTISHDDDEDQINSTAQHKKTTNSNTSQNTNTKSVPFFKLFSFADKFDLFLMLSGALGAAVNGLTLPLMTLLFGQLIDAFGENASTTDQVQREVSKVFLLHSIFYITLT